MAYEERRSYYISTDVIGHSKLRIKLVCASENDFGFRRINSHSNDLNVNAFLVFSYESYERTTLKDGTEKNVFTRGNKIFFSPKNIFKLKKTFSDFSYLLMEDEVYYENEDKHHGYHCEVNEQYKDVIENISNGKLSISLKFGVQKNDETNRFEKGIHIFVGSPEEVVFIPEDIFLSISLVIKSFDLLNAKLNFVSSYLAFKSGNASHKASSNNITEEEI
jgi:hypothetical protein